MENQRAVEIMESYGVIEVVYQGSPVWLEQVEGEMAQVSYINTDKRAEVPIRMLIEK